jgi:hypothetical protein
MWSHLNNVTLLLFVLLSVMVDADSKPSLSHHQTENDTAITGGLSTTGTITATSTTSTPKVFQEDHYRITKVGRKLSSVSRRLVDATTRRPARKLKSSKNDDESYYSKSSKGSYGKGDYDSNGGYVLPDEEIFEEVPIEDEEEVYYSSKSSKSSKSRWYGYGDGYGSGKGKGSKKFFQRLRRRPPPSLEPSTTFGPTSSAQPTVAEVLGIATTFPSLEPTTSSEPSGLGGSNGPSSDPSSFGTVIDGSNAPSVFGSNAPTGVDGGIGSNNPSSEPSVGLDSSLDPTSVGGSNGPSAVPSITPSRLVVDGSNNPSTRPSTRPSTTDSSTNPSLGPSKSPEPSLVPSSTPSRRPSSVPSSDPSSRPSTEPSERPSTVLGAARGAVEDEIVL